MAPTGRTKLSNPRLLLISLVILSSFLSFVVLVSATPNERRSCPSVTNPSDNSFVEYIEVGLELQERGKLKEAQNCFQEFVSHRPEDADGWLMLGDNYRLQRLCFDQALDAYELADRYAQGSSEAQNGIGLCFLNRSTTTTTSSSSSSPSSSSKRDAWKAAEHFLRAILYDETHVPASANLAAALIRLGQREDALKALNRAIGLSPSFSDTPAAKRLFQLINDDTTTTTSNDNESSSSSSSSTTTTATPSVVAVKSPKAAATSTTISSKASPTPPKKTSERTKEDKRSSSKKKLGGDEEEEIIVIRDDVKNPYDNLGTIVTESNSPLPSTQLPLASSPSASPSKGLKEATSTPPSTTASSKPAPTPKRSNVDNNNTNNKRKRSSKEGAITSDDQKAARNAFKSAMVVVGKIDSAATTGAATTTSDNKLVRNAAEFLLKAIEVDPTFEEAWEELHKLRVRTRDHELDIEELEEATEWIPHSSRLHRLLGDALLARAKRLKSTAELNRAAKAYKASIVFNPTTHSLLSLAEIKTRTGKHVEALELLKEAAVLDKNDNNVLLALVNAYQKLGNHSMRTKLLQKLIQREPTNPHHYDRYALALQEAGNYADAIKNYLIAISLAIQSSSDYYRNLGDLYLKVGDIEEALRVYDYAFQQNPNNTKPFMNSLWLIARSCHWEEFNKRLSQLKSIVKREIVENILPPSLPLHHAINYVPSREYFKLAQQWSKHIERIASPSSSSSPTAFDYNRRKLRDERIRVAYVITSRDSFFADARGGRSAASVLSLLEAHNKWRFEVFLYSTVEDESAAQDGKKSELLKLAANAVEHFVPLVGRSPKHVAHRINEDKIQVVVNVEGWNENIHRILSLRPAPVQVGLQHLTPGSSGASWMQYLVTDPVSLPLNIFESVLTENVIQLPLISALREGSDAPFSSSSSSTKSAALNLSPSDRARLRKTILNVTDKATFVYAYFGELTKIDAQTWSLWMRILRQTDSSSSVLWIATEPNSPFDREQHESLQAIAKQHLLYAADRLGVSDSEKRIVFTNNARELSSDSIGACHLFLDSTSHSSSDFVAKALAAGIPVITSTSDKSIQARIGASLVTGAGFPELVVSNGEGYVKLAVELGSNKKQYGELRTRMDAKAKAGSMPIFDIEGWVKSFERGLQQAVEDFEKKNPRKHILL